MIWVGRAIGEGKGEGMGEGEEIKRCEGGGMGEPGRMEGTERKLDG